MKKTLVVVLFALIVSSLFSVEFSGDFRTRYSWVFNWFDSESESDRFIDSRARVQLEVSPFDNLEVIYKVRTQDFAWSGDVRILTEHLYVDYTGLTRTSVKIGRLPWADDKSLVFDAELEGVFYRHEFCNYVSLEAGYGLLSKANLPLHYNLYGTSSLSYGRGADNAIYFFGLDKEKEIGFQTIVNTYKFGPGNNRVYHFWAMPYVNQQWGIMSFNSMLAYNGSFTERRANNQKNTLNNGAALSMDMAFDAGKGGLPGLNVLIATGDDNSDIENTRYFTTIAPDYRNGLELLGIGIHDGSPRGEYGFNPFNQGHGIASVVARYAVPVCEKASLRFAAGALSAVERGLHRWRRNGKIMGGEVNIGVEIQLIENVSLKAIGAYATPGGFFGRNLDDIYGLHSTLDIAF